MAFLSLDFLNLENKTTNKTRDAYYLIFMLLWFKPYFTLSKETHTLVVSDELEYHSRLNGPLS